MDSDVLLELRHVSKTFGATRALIDAGLTVYAGEVHGLLGANGSGKSTMLKVVSGAVPPDTTDPAPKFICRGKTIDPPDGGSFRQHGWGFVHQELALLPALRVVDNFHLSGTLASPGAAISWRSEARRVDEILRRFNLVIDPWSRVERLPPSKRALLAIARAMYEAEISDSAGEGQQVLFLDESTVSLEARDRAELMTVMDNMTRRGCGVVLVSHDLAEVRAITQRVTVLRNGVVAGSMPTAEITDAELLRLVVGSDLAAAPGKAVPVVHGTDAEPAIIVERLGGATVRDVSFSCLPGEVLGLTGLAGSGYEEVPYLLFGDHHDTKPEGTVRVAGALLPVAKLTPQVAIRHGIGLVPGSRATQGAAAAASIWQNVTLPSLVRYRNRARRLVPRAERNAAEAATAAVSMTPPYVTRPFLSLSGGNQQKVVVAKWLNTEPRVLLLHEPTIGIDVGARNQLHILLRATVRNGVSAICASGDSDQLEAICDRVLIFRRGRIRAELRGPEISKQNIAMLSLDNTDD
jgi:ribose transport system ATP-binding protein